MLTELKAHNKYIGFKQSKRAIEAGVAVKAFVAEDCSANIYQTIVDLCRKHNIEIEYVPTMKQLGSECEIDVGSAVVVLTNQ